MIVSSMCFFAVRGVSAECMRRVLSSMCAITSHTRMVYIVRRKKQLSKSNALVAAGSRVGRDCHPRHLHPGGLLRERLGAGRLRPQADRRQPLPLARAGGLPARQKPELREGVVLVVEFRFVSRKIACSLSGNLFCSLSRFFCVFPSLTVPCADSWEY